MIGRLFRGLATVGLLVLSTVQGGWAATAQEQLKGAIEKGEGKAAERRAAVRQIANEIFDFGEIARRSLGRYWQPLSETQRAEFVELFGDLLERSYISKIELYGGEKIIYSGERMDGDLAIVSTKIITKNGTEVPIDYRLFRRGDNWKVYDVNIEGISLVSNYRTQFNKIIQSSGYNTLVDRMKAKQTESFENTSEKKKALK